MIEIIKVAHLQKSFGTFDVIKDISFSVHKGEVLGIIGPSGSGKSTMLRCINQLETVSSGTIEICGDVLVHNGIYADKKTLRRIGLRSGMVFQNFNLFPHFTVLRNITEAQIRVLGIDKKEAVDTARALLDRMGLTDKKDSYPCELSGGQQQRVSIARALALKPEVLCFDEPTSALDPELTGEILKVIKSLCKRTPTDTFLFTCFGLIPLKRSVQSFHAPAPITNRLSSPNRLESSKPGTSTDFSVPLR